MKISTRITIGAAASGFAAVAAAGLSASASASHGASLADCPPVFQSRLTSLEAENMMYKTYLSSGDDCQAEIGHVAGKVDELATALEEREKALQSDMEEMASIRDEAAQKEAEIGRLRAELKHETFVRESAQKHSEILKKTIRYLKQDKESTERAINEKYQEERRHRISKGKQADVLAEQLNKLKPFYTQQQRPQENSRAQHVHHSEVEVEVEVVAPASRETTQLSLRPMSTYRFSPGDGVEYNVIEGDSAVSYPAIIMEPSHVNVEHGHVGLTFSPSYRLLNQATLQCIDPVHEIEIARYLPHEPDMEVLCKSCFECQDAWWPCQIIEYRPVPHGGPVLLGSYVVENLGSGEEVTLSAMWTKWADDMYVNEEIQPQRAEGALDESITFDIGDHVEYRQDSLDEEVISLRPASIVGGPFTNDAEDSDSEEVEDSANYHVITFDDNSFHKHVPVNRISVLLPHTVGDIIHCTNSSFYLTTEERASLRVKIDEQFVPCEVEHYLPHPQASMVAFGAYHVRNLMSDKRALVMVRTTRNILDTARTSDAVLPFVEQSEVTGAPTMTGAPTFIPIQSKGEDFRSVMNADCAKEGECGDSSVTIMARPTES